MSQRIAVLNVTNLIIRKVRSYCMLPVQITVRDMPSSPALEDHILKKAQKLNHYYALMFPLFILTLINLSSPFQRNLVASPARRNPAWRWARQARKKWGAVA